jgi:uncharacterized protein (TIGR02147 family)
MNVFDFKSYKAYIRHRIEAMPKKGRGEYLKLARMLGVHSTMISHVFKGDAHLSIEQGIKVAGHYFLNGHETDYFVNLIQHERAGDEPTRKYFAAKLEDIKNKQLDLSERIDAGQVMDEKDQAVFYSHWYYLGIQILTSIPGFQDPAAIASHLRLPNEIVLEALEFLVRTGLCMRAGDGYKVGITRTYVKRDSPLVSRHHTNWRLRVMQQFPDIEDGELVYTCPTSISKDDFMFIRERIARFIEEFNKTIAPSKDEQFACLNLDWVKIRP